MTDQEVMQKFFERYPEYAVQANRSFLLEGATKPLTVESLAEAAHQLRDTLLFAPEFESKFGAFLYHNNKKKSFATRAEFLEEIRGEREGIEYETLVRQLGEKFRGRTLDQLREVAEKRRIQGLTASEFKQERAANAPKKVVNHYDGYPLLPEFLVLEGAVQATRIDAAFLLNLIRADYYLYRRLFNKYGGAQLTDRQNGV